MWLAMTTVLPIPVAQSRWRSATWVDYQQYRDTKTNNDRARLFFNAGYLLVEDMSSEGIEHAGFCDLFTMILFAWFSRQPGQTFASLGRCLIEKPDLQAAAPDLVLYLGEDYPQSSNQWQVGEKRRIELDRVRVPNLVGEISDTTLAGDLDEKKRLYALMGMPEYWVIDVQARRIFMFLLQGDGVYLEVEESGALVGLGKGLVEQMLGRMGVESNGAVAMWFAQQITAK
jgi:Uma2 family endonuclease